MTLLQHTPNFTAEDAARLAAAHYDLQTTASPLPSERDQNFLLQTAAGDRYVLKIANATEDAAFLDAQHQILDHLGHRGVDFCQRVLPATSGEPSIILGHHHVRLLTYVRGRPLGAIKRHSDDLRRDLGAKLGQLDRALADFDHPALHRTFHWDLAQVQDVVERLEHAVAEPTMRATITRLAAAFAQRTAPRLAGLRRGPIHNDANDYNVIVGGGEDLYSRNQYVTGLIDFGDMVHSFTVAELAIACAYVALNSDDPLAAMLPVVAGYHAHNPLTDDEFAVLFDLVCMRLCVSVCIAAEQQAQRPDDPYLAISQQPIRRTLPKLAQIPARLAEAAFRHACGLAPIPAADRVCAWLQAHQPEFAPAVDVDLHADNLVVYDLSVGSPLVEGDEARNRAALFTSRLDDVLSAADASVGIGRYDEPRLIYTAPFFKTGDGPLGERRTIHLGIDIFRPAGASVYAPLPGTVHAFANNAAHQDYGPVILLRHQAGDDTFFTLYGHLSLASLEGLTVGQPIAAGDQIATLGAGDVNGGWPPHLHFQIITDLLDLGIDFPGVGPASQRAVWTALSPDPNLILGIDPSCFPAPPPAKDVTLATRRRRLGRNLSIGYRDPVKVERGWMQYLFDETGRRYLDAYNNVPHVGHCHPQVVAAARAQMGVLNTNTRYLHDLLNRYAETLCATLPDPLSVCYFVNSASEANELALRLVRAFTSHKEMIVLEGAYHGHTTGLIDISPYKHDGPGGRGAPDWVFTAPVADIYRGAYKATDPAAGTKYAAHVAEIVDQLHAQGRGLGGYIAESCPSVGGQIIFPPGYLASVYGHVRQAGGLCIADEVQTGYGRTGSHMYAFEAQHVVPDIVILGKPIGNGHPIGAVITTPEIADAFDNGMEFFSTFGGNTVSCAVGLAVLDVLAAEDLQSHAQCVGNRMLASLRPFVDRFKLVGDVRGAGLFLGVELVRNRDTLEPAGAEASYISNRMRDHGILLGTDGPFHNVVKIRPPMPFDEANADLLVQALGGVLEELEHDAFAV
ncbi:MAG: aminotransferase class III-fold pyridoxal phosphate-dependent enzyme [Caldilineaceae bacterium]